MREWLRRHRPDLLLALFAGLLALLVLAVPHCARAQDPDPAPFKLACPDVKRCGAAPGVWLSTAYMKKLGADVTLLEGCQKERALFEGEVAQHKAGLNSAMLRVTTLEERLVARDKDLSAMLRAREDDRDLIEQRTRLAIAASALVVALGIALGASYYAAAH